MLGDTAYGNGPVRAELAERDIDVLAPVPENKVDEGRSRQARLHDRLRRRHRPLPGRTHRPGQRLQNGYRAANFSAAMCGDCPLKRAAAQPSHDARSSSVEHEELLQPADKHSLTPRQASTSDAHDHGSNGCSDCSPTATAPARADTSAARRPDCRPPGPLHWSTSTRSPAISPTTPRELRPNPPATPTADAARPGQSLAAPKRTHINTQPAATGRPRTHFFRSLLASGPRPSPKPTRSARHGRIDHASRSSRPSSSSPMPRPIPRAAPVINAVRVTS